MRRSILLLPILLLWGCGGGGGGGNPNEVTLQGRLSLPAVAPLRAEALTVRPGADVEPNNSAACARLLRGDAIGVVDAARDPVDVFRVVARTTGPVTARVEGDVDAVLHDLATGRVARSLDAEPGTVFDIVVTGTGAYRVRLANDEPDRAARSLPARYHDCDHGFAARQLIAAPVAGVSPAQLAAAGGLTCLKEGKRACLYETPAPRGEAEFDRLCELLARCARLQDDGLVRYAEPNYRRRLTISPNDECFGLQWGMRQIRAPAAWDITTGGTIVVAVVDSGIRAHPELISRTLPGYDFRDDDDDPTDLTSGFSHGTQTAGIAVAATNNGDGVAAVLWDGRVIPIRAFGVSGFGVAFDIANGILFGAGLENVSGMVPELPAQVMNLSFASGIPTAIEEEACADAMDAGVFLIAASGNGGRNTIQYPGGYDSVMTSGATSIDGVAASYSNFGPWVDIVAPGGTKADGIKTTGVNSSGQFTYPMVDGTSFAAPHVAGVAGLVLSVAPDTTVAELWQILIATAQDVGPAGYDERHGYGIVDAYRAVLAASGGEVPVLIPGEIVRVRLLTVPGDSIAFSATTTEGAGLQWSMPGVTSGTYRLVAGTDRNFDGEIAGVGEVAGTWTDSQGSDVLTIVAGEPLPSLDFVIAPQ